MKKSFIACMTIAAFGAHAESREIFTCGEYITVSAKDFVEKDGAHSNYIAVTKNENGKGIVIAGNSEIIGVKYDKPFHSLSLDFDGNILDTVSMPSYPDKGDSPTWLFMTEMNAEGNSKTRLIKVSSTGSVKFDCKRMTL